LLPEPTLTVSGFEGRFRFAYTLNGYTLVTSTFGPTAKKERGKSHPVIRPGIIGAFTEGG